MSNLEMITDDILNLDINRAVNACINNNSFLMHTNTVFGIFSHAIYPNMEKKMDERKKISSTITNITNHNKASSYKNTSDQQNILSKRFFTIHCDSWDEAMQYWADNQQYCSTIKKLTSSWFAGYITIIAANKQDMQKRGASEQQANNVDVHNKIGVRVPSCEKVQRVLKTLGVPIIATSANIHGCLPLRQTQEICKTFPNIEVILPNCDCTMGLDSTVLELTNGNIYVKRRGIIPLQLISETIGKSVMIDNQASYEHMFWLLDGKRNIVHNDPKNDPKTDLQSDCCGNMEYIDHCVGTIQFIKNNQCYLRVVNIFCYFGIKKPCIYCDNTLHCHNYHQWQKDYLYDINYANNINDITNGCFFVHNNIRTTQNNDWQNKCEIFLCSNMMCDYISIINFFIQNINNTQEKFLHCIFHDHYKEPGKEILYNLDDQTKEQVSLHHANASFIGAAHMLFQSLLLLMRNAYTNSK